VFLIRILSSSNLAAIITVMGAGKGKNRRAQMANASVSSSETSSDDAYSGNAYERLRALRMLAASYGDTGSSMPTSDMADDLFDEELLGLNPAVAPGDGETVFTVYGKEVLEETLKSLKVTDDVSQESLLCALGALQLGWDQISDDDYDKLLAQGVFVESGEGDSLGVSLSDSSWELVQKLISGEASESSLALEKAASDRVTF
jgi:hypothetical protein